MSADPDFGHGEGDPLGGPTVADTRIDQDIYQAKIEFKVKQQNWTTRTIVMSFQDPDGEAEEHLMALWRIWHRDTIEAARLAGGTGDIPLT